MANLVKEITAVLTGGPQLKGAKIDEPFSLVSYGIPKNSKTILHVFHSLRVVFSNGNYLSMLAFVAVNFLMGCHDDDHGEPWQQEVDQLRLAVTSYGDIDNATDKGYDAEITGYVSQMGFHYLKESNLDKKFDVGNPEILVYIPDGHGGLKFVAVEYAVAIDDLNNPPPAPEGFKGDADVWVINTEFSVWTLHAWVGMDNPHGIFHAHNPNIP